MKKHRKKSKKLQTDLNGRAKQVSNPSEDSTNEQSENPWDFGGLTARNLKKNLGCG